MGGGTEASGFPIDFGDWQHVFMRCMKEFWADAGGECRGFYEVDLDRAGQARGPESVHDHGISHEATKVSGFPADLLFFLLRGFVPSCESMKPT